MPSGYAPCYNSPCASRTPWKIQANFWPYHPRYSSPLSLRVPSEHASLTKSSDVLTSPWLTWRMRSTSLRPAFCSSSGRCPGCWTRPQIENTLFGVLSWSLPQRVPSWKIIGDLLLLRRIFCWLICQMRLLKKIELYILHNSHRHQRFSELRTWQPYVLHICLRGSYRNWLGNYNREVFHSI